MVERRVQTSLSLLRDKKGNGENAIVANVLYEYNKSRARKVIISR